MSDFESLNLAKYLIFFPGNNGFLYFFLKIFKVADRNYSVTKLSSYYFYLIAIHPYRCTTRLYAYRFFLCI